VIIPSPNPVTVQIIEEQKTVDDQSKEFATAQSVQ
jgi:hypothetical protein